MVTHARSWLLAKARHLVGLPPMTVGRKEAVARAIAAWAYQTGREPSEVGPLWPTPQPSEGLWGWTVHLRPNVKPGAWVTVDGWSGDVSRVRPRVKRPVIEACVALKESEEQRRTGHEREFS